MTNKRFNGLGLVKDYLDRSKARLKALDVFYREESWADTVRESSEVVELTLKAYLRFHGILPPRIHDVSPILEENLARFPADHKKDLENFIEISRKMRRDRELAFYGSEDLTPSQFYRKKDADQALDAAKLIFKTVMKWVPKG